MESVVSAELLKFANRQTDNGKKLFWGRAPVDGAPFRGTMAPQYTEDEFSERTHRVHDAHNGVFDPLDPEDNRRYLEVMEGWANRWYQIVFIDRQWTDVKRPGRRLIYIEWLVPFLEDGTAASGGEPIVMEAGGHGPFYRTNAFS